MWPPPGLDTDGDITRGKEKMEATKIRKIQFKSIGNSTLPAPEQLLLQPLLSLWNSQKNDSPSTVLGFLGGPFCPREGLEGEFLLVFLDGSFQRRPGMRRTQHRNSRDPKILGMGTRGRICQGIPGKGHKTSAMDWGQRHRPRPLPTLHLLINPALISAN